MARKATASLAELGKAVDAVVTMLPTGKEVREALFTMQGGALAANMKPGALVIDMSSADPVGTRALGAELAAAQDRAGRCAGFRRRAARQGRLARDHDRRRCGRGRASASRCSPAWASKLFEVGSLGCGHAMKCLNNFLAGTSFAAAAEAVTVGRKFGLDPKVMVDVINVSTGRSFASENLIQQHVLSGAFGTGFALGLLAKDVRIAADLADQIGVDAPVGRLVRDLWADARENLGGDQDHTRAATHWEKRALPKAAE